MLFTPTVSGLAHVSPRYEADYVENISASYFILMRRADSFLTERSGSLFLVNIFSISNKKHTMSYAASFSNRCIHYNNFPRNSRIVRVAEWW